MTRLLVLRLSALGDVIHTIPAVSTLRPAHVSWVVEAPYAELVEIVAGVEAIPVRMKAWGRSPVSSRHHIHEAIGRMRGSQVSVDFQGLVKSAMLGVLARARRRVGFDRAAIREKPALLFTNEKVAVDTSKHVVDQNLALAAHLASGGASPPPPPRWDAFPQALDTRPARFVLLPGAGKPGKLWPIERFREVAGRLGDEVMVVWGPGEAERAQAVGARMAPPTNLRELAWLLQQAEVVIGGDTGPLHLAAALGTKVVGLYGPTDPRRNGPHGQLDHVVDEFAATKLMGSITVEAVMNLLEKVAAE